MPPICPGCRKWQMIKTDHEEWWETGVLFVCEACGFSVMGGGAPYIPKQLQEEIDKEDSD